MVIRVQLATLIFGFGRMLKQHRRFISVLADFGAPLHDLTVDDLASPGMVFQIGVEPSRIDILTAISGVVFDNAWENRMSIEMDNIKLNVIGRTDLIVNKRACGRPKDIADAESLDPSDT